MEATQVRASEALEAFLLKHRLVLTETLKAWATATADQRLEESLVLYCRLFPWDRWAEVFTHGMEEWPVLYPVDPTHPVPPKALEPAARRLAREWYALLLQENPVLVFGILNPFVLLELEKELAYLYPGQPKRIVLLAPQDYANFVAAIERGQLADPGWDQEDLARWAEALGLEPGLYSAPTDLVSELWMASESRPVVPRGSVWQAGPLSEDMEALLWRRSATNAWIVTPQALSEELLDRLMEKLNAKIRIFACPPSYFEELRQRFDAQKPRSPIFWGDPLHVRDWPICDLEDTNRAGITLFDALLNRALDMGASDISLEPKVDFVRVRFRIQGDYYEQAPLTRRQYAVLLDRIKLFGNMAPDAKGILQDGSGCHLYRGVRYDQRYNIVVAKGMEEAVAIRIFSARVPTLADLQLAALEQRTLLWFLSQGEGMFLSTGPTGSGKTTTLYALLHQLSTPRCKIVTVEDPVEKHFPDALQIEIREEAGITFERALRAVVRQDPDVLMVGEIRDSESAKIAINASLTGHLVLSSIHASDAVGVLERLVQSFGIDRLVAGYALKLVVSQRLVSPLCPYCKKTRPATRSDLALFPPVPIPEPVVAESAGCLACRGTGRAARIPLMELFPIDGEILALIEENAPPWKLRAHNEGRGYKSLATQAAELFLTGVLSREEALLLCAYRRAHPGG
ncbi:GspE/PulE family protein [Candidatus Methylacidithermus pantelleriae]|nr:ATPase, T2SS/T4P/T4SS family [Candidatus Methylacidithermus pantelleriae]